MEVYIARKRTYKKHKNHVKQKSTISPTPDKGTFVQRNHYHAERPPEVQQVCSAKDTLFRFIFRDKQKLLQLYNALNNSEYDNVEALTVTTIENVLYLGYKNDVSFLLDQSMCLFEHQGSWNPNMPLRGVLYFARLFQEYIDSKGLNLYGSRKLLLPVPRYVVFYNGSTKRPEREILKLSDMYQKSSESKQLSDLWPLEETLECRALVLNINYGNNQALLEKCKPLMDYSKFIHCIRQNILRGLSSTAAVDLAVNDCIKNNILSDVLKAHRKEVINMFLEEYDQELHFKTLREEGYEDGYLDGTDHGIVKGVDKGIDIGETTINSLAQKMAADRRIGDFLRSTTDRSYQKQLLIEYGLAK